MLAFGEDEEVDSHGVRTALAAELARRGVHAAFSLDEGVTTFSDAGPYGAPGVTLIDVCLSQKGYLDVRLRARGAGGHSSNPFGGTSLERLLPRHRAPLRGAARPAAHARRGPDLPPARAVRPP